MFAIPTSNCVIPYFTLYSGVCICMFNFVVCLQTFPQAERPALCVCVQGAVPVFVCVVLRARAG